MNSNKTSFAEYLGLIFITLKLTSVIDWSWWWVLSPIIVKIIAEVLIEANKSK
mgnify:CR=1 FL=1